MQGLDAAYNDGASLKPPQRSQADLSDTGSGNDSLLDLYKSSKESLPKTTTRDTQRIKRKGSLGAVSALGPTSDDPDKWIHRDKLQQIEIREMMAEGRRLDFPRRTESRGAPKSQNASTVAEDEAADGEGYNLTHIQKRQRTVSPGLSSHELREEPNDYTQSTETYEPSGSPGETRPRRPSSSRIPVTKPGFTTDEAPSSFRYDKTRRARSGSQGSQHLLDNTTTNAKSFGSKSQSSPGSPQDSSPAKTRIASKGKTTRGTRGPSRGGRAASGQTRPPTATASAANGLTSRPGTSGASRPPSARPEDEPPWAGSMFKPDPRLPPDQQMLPTHARRLAQQQSGGQTRPHDDLTLLDDDDSPAEEQANGFSEDERVDARKQYMDNVQNNRNTSPQKKLSPHLEPAAWDSPKSQNRSSWLSQGRKSPNTAGNRDSGQWPLRTLSFNKYAAEPPAQVQAQTQGQTQAETSPKSDSEPFASPVSASRSNSTEPAGYSLMPTIQSPKEMEQRLSARSAVPPGQSAEQPVRLPEEPDADAKEKKKGCAGCCIVM